MLTRYKTFDATGVATSGRIYAGDLNAMQDAAAAQSDFAQTIDVVTLRVGDTGLQLLKYGTGEGRFTGLLRVDGILRGLGGLIAGGFTTTERNALVLPPATVVIWNTTTGRLEANVGTDVAPVWQAVGRLPSDNDLIDTYANRPGAGTVLAGTRFSSSDTMGVWRSSGSAWVLVAQGRPRIDVATFRAAPFSTVPYDGQEVTIIADAATEWTVKYNNATSVWLPIGRPVPLSAYTATDANNASAGSSPVIFDIPNGGPSVPSVTVPLDGSYVIVLRSVYYGTGQAKAYIVAKIGAAAADINDAAGGAMNNTPTVTWPAMMHGELPPKSLTRTTVISMQYASGDNLASSMHFKQRRIGLIPISVTTA